MNINDFYKKYNNFEGYSVVNLFKDDIIKLMEDYSKLKLKEYKESKCKKTNVDFKDYE
jgi:hypothetical protein